jgi:predicted DNA-binding protein
MRKGKEQMHIRMTPNQKERLVFLANAEGFKTFLEYIRHRIFNQNFDLKLNKLIEDVEEIKNDIKKLVQE